MAIQGSQLYLSWSFVQMLAVVSQPCLCPSLTLPLEARERCKQDVGIISCFFGHPYLKKDLSSNVGSWLLQRSCCSSLVTIAERTGNISMLIFSSLNNDVWLVFIQKTYKVKMEIDFEHFFVQVELTTFCSREDYKYSFPSTFYSRLSTVRIVDFLQSHGSWGTSVKKSKRKNHIIK